MQTDKAPEWDKAVDKDAVALLNDKLDAGATFTSLDFKKDLRAVVGKEKKVLQKDVSRFLRRWFMKDGKKKDYTYVERRVPALHYEYQPIHPPPEDDVLVEAKRLLGLNAVDVKPKEYREVLERLVKTLEK